MDNNLLQSVDRLHYHAQLSAQRDPNDRSQHFWRVGGQADWFLGRHLFLVRYDLEADVVRQRANESMALEVGEAKVHASPDDTLASHSDAVLNALLHVHWPGDDGVSGKQERDSTPTSTMTLRSLSDTASCLRRQRAWTRGACGWP